MIQPSVFDYTKAQENAYETEEIRLGENWNWNMRRHLQMIFHLKNGVFYSGENDWLRAFKNIMEPMLDLAYWTEDIEVKDVEFYIKSKNGRALAFLLKKYHDEVYVKEHDLDTLFDEITESDIDYGGVLVQKAKGRPEVIPLTSIAFCDQTEILGGPLAPKHNFSPEKLRSVGSKRGWGDRSNGADISLDELIVLADETKDVSGSANDQRNRTPGKTIEVYILRGSLPEHYLLDNDNFEDWYNQIHVLAFYTNEKKEKKGVTLYKKKEREGNIKYHTSKVVDGRGLGRGAGEALLHPQIWTNFLEIHQNQMLEAGAKVPLVTDDPDFPNRNVIQDMENLEVTTVTSGTQIPPQPIQTAAVANIQLYENSINSWFEHTQLTAKAFDPVLGKEATSGTTFRGQERTVAQGRGSHDRRRGQRAKFIEEIYRDWIIPEMVKEIVKGKKFLATLSTEELQYVRQAMEDKFIFEKQKEAIFNMEVPPPTQVLKEMFGEQFAKRGNKQLIEILKDEFDGIEIEMGISVANKQKDLALLSDKLLSVFQFIFTNPQAFQQAMQVPALAKSFSDILEFSGLSEVDFSSLMTAEPVQEALPQPQQQQPEQIQFNRQPQEA